MKYELGSKLKYFRQQRGMSQKELAEKIGVTNSRLSNWENGINRPDADILAVICRQLGISADELLDIPVSNDDLNEDERQVLMLYRKKPEMRHAIHVLLGIRDQ